MQPPGTLEGGERKESSTGYLRRKREIRELSARGKLLTERRPRRASGSDASARPIASLSAERDRILDRVHLTEVELAEARKEQALAQESMKTAAQRLEILRWELEERTSDLTRIDESQKRDGETAQRRESRIQEAEERIRRLEDERKGARKIWMAFERR